MLFRAALISCCLILPTMSLAAEKAAKKPIGTWVREAGGNKLRFAFTADKITISLTTEDAKVAAEAAYGVTADGTVFAILTKVEKHDLEEGPKKGDMFSFEIDAGKSEMTISNLKGSRIPEEGGRIVEGVYSREKK